MDYVAMYQEKLQQTRKQQPIGYVPYKIRPVTERGENAFAKVIDYKVGKKDVNVFYRLLNHLELSKIKALVNEKNFEAAGFNRTAEIYYSEEVTGSLEGLKQTIQINVAKTIDNVTVTDIKIELGEFIPYAKVDELGFNDIPDLRK